MKSRISLVLLICGFAALLGLVVYLTRTLYKIDSQDKTRITAVPAAPARPQAQPLSDAVIEVGKDDSTKDTDKTPRAADKTVASDMAIKQSGAEPLYVGKVIYISGTVSATDQLGKARLLALNSDIFRRERIETTPNAKLNIKFTDGTTISQGEKSAIVIDECIYDPVSPEKCCFVGRFTRGICRVVTGLITDINPQRFTIRTKMATVGIRGCELVFKSSSAKDDIYVLELGRAKSVEVQTTSNGTPIMDTTTGGTLPVDKTKMVDMSITDPQTAVTIANGKCPEERKVGAEEARELITEASNLTPARYELLQKADGATLRIAPAPASSQDNSTQEK